MVEGKTSISALPVILLRKKPWGGASKGDLVFYSTI